MSTEQDFVVETPRAAIREMSDAQLTQAQKELQNQMDEVAEMLRISKAELKAQEEAMAFDEFQRDKRRKAELRALEDEQSRRDEAFVRVKPPHDIASYRALPISVKCALLSEF